MSKRKKKEAAARAVVIGVVALCLGVVAIFGIWAIGKLTNDPGAEPGRTTADTALSGTTGSAETTAATTSPQEVEALVEQYIGKMLEGRSLKVAYDDVSVRIGAAEANAPYSDDELRRYLSENGQDGALADAYLALGHSGADREIDEGYVTARLYELGDSINRQNDQGYSIDGRTVTITRADRLVSVDLEKTMALVRNSLTAGDYSDVEAVVSVNPDGEPDWDEIAARVNTEPKDAAYVYNEETKMAELVPETVGYQLDIERMKRDYSTNGGRVFKYTAEEILPEITTENIREKLFPDRIASYTTWYNSNEENRTTNLKLAAEYVNGTVILPGKRFSYNNSVGERTEERGFKEAIIFTRDGLSDGLGGGICQVSSTLYCCALFSDMKIVERWNHGYTVSYVDLGRDATVSYGWLDFRFENNREDPIIIVTSASGGMLTVEFYGTERESLVVYLEHEKAETIEPKIRTKVDPSLGDEEYKLESKGKNG